VLKERGKNRSKRQEWILVRMDVQSRLAEKSTEMEQYILVNHTTLETSALWWSGSVGGTVVADLLLTDADAGGRAQLRRTSRGTQCVTDRSILLHCSYSVTWLHNWTTWPRGNWTNCLLLSSLSASSFTLIQYSAPTVCWPRFSELN